MFLLVKIRVFSLLGAKRKAKEDLVATPARAMAYREVPLFDQVDHWKEFAIQRDLEDEEPRSGMSNHHQVQLTNTNIIGARNVREAGGAFSYRTTTSSTSKLRNRLIFWYVRVLVFRAVARVLTSISLCTHTPTRVRTHALKRKQPLTFVHACTPKHFLNKHTPTKTHAVHTHCRSIRRTYNQTIELVEESLDAALVGDNAIRITFPFTVLPTVLFYEKTHGTAHTHTYVHTQRFLPLRLCSPPFLTFFVFLYFSGDRACVCVFVGTTARTLYRFVFSHPSALSPQTYTPRVRQFTAAHTPHTVSLPLCVTVFQLTHIALQITLLLYENRALAAMRCLAFSAMSQCKHSIILNNTKQTTSPT